MKKLRKLLLASLIVGFLGTYFSYNGPLSSATWRYWSEDAWLKDGARLLLVFIFANAILFLINFSKAEGTTNHDSDSSQYRRGYRYECIVIAIALIFLLIFNFAISPPSFHDELLVRLDEDKDTQKAERIRQLIENDYFNEIYKPYFVYIFHSTSFWIGLSLSTMLSILRGFLPDWKDLTDVRKDIKETCNDSEEPAPEAGAKPILDLDKIVLIKVKLSFFNAKLRDISERYMPIGFIIIIGLLIESRTKAYESVTAIALEIIKFIALTVVLFFVLTTFLLIAEHQRVIKLIDIYLDKVLQQWLSKGNLETDSESIEKYTEFRRELAESQNSFDFFISTVKNASFLIPLLAVILVYLIDSIAGNDWTFLVPRTILEIIESIYG